MRKNNKNNYKITTWPQEKAKYKELAMRIEKLDKKFNKQFSKIFEILNKLTKNAK